MAGGQVSHTLRRTNRLQLDPTPSAYNDKVLIAMQLQLQSTDSVVLKRQGTNSNAVRNTKHFQHCSYKHKALTALQLKRQSTESISAETTRYTMQDHSNAATNTTYTLLSLFYFGTLYKLVTRTSWCILSHYFSFLYICSL